MNLQALDYSKAFRGKLDSSICELQHLTSLNLGNHYLEGKIPKCIGSLGRLIELNLMNNNFVSVIPPSLGNLSNLQTLNHADNILIITNDLEWLSHLFGLRYLDLSYVNLTLVVDWLSSISKIPSLSELHLYNCGLHQVTPKSIDLDISNSGISDSFPKWFWNLSSSLEYLNVSHNKLNGPLPKSFPCMKVSYDYDDRVWDFSSNNLNGSLPSFPKLRSLFLSNNMFTGSLSSFCTSQSHSLIYLDLSSNLLAAGETFRLLGEFSIFSSSTFK